MIRIKDNDSKQYYTILYFCEDDLTGRVPLPSTELKSSRFRRLSTLR